MLRFDERGVLLANVPNSGAATLDPNAKSGNDAHDTASGKFASKGGDKDDGKTVAPANVDPLDYKRMIDAVRDAARQFDVPEIGDIKEFLAGRAKSPDTVDAEAFLQQVVEQKKADAVDLFDQAMRSSGILPRGSRRVRLSAPRGYVRKLLNQMSADTQAEIMHRLEAKGHDEADVEAFFNSKVKEEKHAEAVTKKSAIAASDSWNSEGIAFEDVDFFDSTSDAVAMAEAIAKNLPQPIINVTPQITVEAPKPFRKEVVRDDNGFVTGVVEVAE